jgi:hypothetical protein
MSKLVVILLFACGARAETPQDVQRVNQHLSRTNSKIELERQKTEVENEQTAPKFDRTPTFDDPVKYRSYGVEMQQSLPFDDLDLDHLEEKAPQDNNL